jgi:hypothetical protein
MLHFGFVSAQSVTKHIVFFKDKDNSPYSLSNPQDFLTQRSIDRRVRNNIPYVEKDLPVTPAYTTQVAATGATVLYSLKWFNALAISVNSPTILGAIANLPFVDHISGSGKGFQGSVPKGSGINQVGVVLPHSIALPESTGFSDANTTFNYGNAWNQISMLGLQNLHNLGFTGEGLMVAILDAGFWDVDQGDAFSYLWQHNLISGTRDFVDIGGNVFIQHTHGESVLSILAANLPGQMMGSAPDAAYWLIRTEDAWGGEYLLEEYNWAAGAELADSVGADIITSSLGYTTFDNTAYDHTYADMDGNTTPCVQAADFAASRGILVVNSAGNYGEMDWHYISTPADGDSVFTIGAVNESGTYLALSGKGPTSDGQIKPDVVAQGYNTAIIYGNGVLTVGTGTSFATPIVSGALACLWQAFPNATAEDLRRIVRNTAINPGFPNNHIGWGIPDVMDAYSQLIYLSANQPSRIEAQTFKLSPVPFSDHITLFAGKYINTPIKVEMYNSCGLLVLETDFDLALGLQQEIKGVDGLPAGLYVAKIRWQNHQENIRVVKK